MSDRFWDAVAPLLAAGRLEEGTMFGFRCVRAGKVFKEWVAINATEDWGPYLDEALEFAGG